MYHQGHGGGDIFSPRGAFSQERHLFLHSGNTHADSGLVLSTDAKPRLKWTPELHQRFIEAVNQLGGAESEFINFKIICFVPQKSFHILHAAIYYI